MGSAVYKRFGAGFWADRLGGFGEIIARLGRVGARERERERERERDTK